MNLKVALAGILCALPLVGCGPKTQSYDVIVTNRLENPITVWLTKDAAPYGPGWEPPEVLAIGNSQDNLVGGVVLQPGVTQEAKRSGEFSDENIAVLRIYRATSLNSILALSRGSGDRYDVPLNPGKIDVDITSENGRLAVVPHGSSIPTTRP